MTNEKEIVWIGNKPVKRINRGDIPFYFNRMEPTSVPTQMAQELLQHENCFALPNRAKGIDEMLKQEAQNIEAEKIKTAEELAKEEILQGWMVYVDGEQVNISKYTNAKLETVIVAEKLDIDSASLTDVTGQTKLETLRITVREALRAKSGIPGLDETTDAETADEQGE